MSELTTQPPTSAHLTRQLGLFGATMMGLGSIIGTGVFVSIGIAAGVAGPSVILAVMVAAGVATANALSSAQLAASHPVSGGTYEYGYHYLRPWLGFTAGWFFLLAKSASAATAALGFAGYLLDFLGVSNDDLLVPVALAAVIILTAVVLAGIRRSNLTNSLIVSLTLLALGVFVLAGIPEIDGDHLRPFFTTGPDSDRGALAGFLQAAALMFVAYTGYARIATLGEEVHEPRRTIPRAIILTLLLTMVLYLAVTVVAVGSFGAGPLSRAAQSAAPLEAAAQTFELSAAARIVAVGAMTAMLGVLLNLILGLSRVLLAMGRRRDMPPVVARLNASRTTPTAAVIVIAAGIGLLVLVGSVKTTWSFSAFNVLLYYAITNLAALRLPRAERLYPRWIAAAGLVACAFLAFWVEPAIWLASLGILVVGLGWFGLSKRAFA